VERWRAYVHVMTELAEVTATAVQEGETHAGFLWSGQTREQRIEGIAAFLALPAHLRPARTIGELARLSGVKTGAEVYSLMRDPEVLRRALAATVAGVIDRLPGVLESLADAAEGGSARAADVLLRHVRELVGLAGEGVQRSAVLHVHLEDTAKAAGRLTVLAAALVGASVPRSSTEASRSSTEAGVASSDAPAERWAERAAASLPPPSPPVPLLRAVVPPKGPIHGGTASVGDAVATVPQDDVGQRGADDDLHVIL
jgi:hypothetical protein